MGTVIRKREILNETKLFRLVGLRTEVQRRRLERANKFENLIFSEGANVSFFSSLIIDGLVKLIDVDKYRGVIRRCKGMSDARNSDVKTKTNGGRKVRITSEKRMTLKERFPRRCLKRCGWGLGPR